MSKSSAKELDQQLCQLIAKSIPCDYEAAGGECCGHHARRRMLLREHSMLHLYRFNLCCKRELIETTSRSKSQKKESLHELDKLIDEIDGRHQMLENLARTLVPPRSIPHVEDCLKACQEINGVRVYNEQCCQCLCPFIFECQSPSNTPLIPGQKGHTVQAIAEMNDELPECDCVLASRTLQSMISTPSSISPQHLPSLSELPAVFQDNEDKNVIIREEKQLQHRRKNRHRLTSAAQYSSVGSNVFLMIIKAFAAYYSRSLSIFANALDSVLDILSGLVLFFSSRAAKKPRSTSAALRYPLGRSKSETLGVIMFACIMGAFALTLVINGIQTLASGDAAVAMTFWPILIMGVTIGLKLILCIGCRIVYQHTFSSTVKAYSIDHFNDTLTNTAAIVAAIITSKFPNKVPWLDAAVSIALALYILVNWIGQARQNLPMLMEKRAPEEISNRLCWATLHHDPRIKDVETVDACYWGSKYFAEIHLVMQPSLPLQEAHDVGESFTQALERWSDIHRAYVHSDCDDDFREHTDEHKSAWH